MICAPCRLDGWTEEEHMAEVRANALFSLFLTRAFLPSLRATARARPALVVFMGSFSDETSMARIALYSASKRFDRGVVFGLQADERFDTPDDKAISFMYIHLALVQTQMNPESPNLVRPSAEAFARKLVGTFGCGRQIVVPYVGHYLLKLVMTSLPEFILAPMMHNATREYLEKGAKKSKSQS